MGRITKVLGQKRGKLRFVAARHSGLPAKRKDEGVRNENTGCSENVIPVLGKTVTKHSLPHKRLKTNITVKGKALPLIPAYWKTTHNSQGQTLPKIVIDLNMPPRAVEVASAYVPLSRVKKLADLVILQDFSVDVLRVKPSRGQIDELKRLANFFEQTKQRYIQYFV